MSVLGRRCALDAITLSYEQTAYVKRTLSDIMESIEVIPHIIHSFPGVVSNGSYG